jgi:hypothetical protein
MAAFPLPPVAVVVGHDEEYEVEVEKLLEDPSDQEPQVVVDEDELDEPGAVGTTVTVV